MSAGTFIPVVSGRGRYALRGGVSRVRRTRVRHLLPVPRSDPSTHRHVPGRHSASASALSCLLVNARSVHNKTSLIHDIIVDEQADLACLTETWVGPEGGASLSLLCPPGFQVQWAGRSEGRGGGVAIVFRESLQVSKATALVRPGVECLHLSVGQRDKFGIVLVYRAPRNPAQSFPEISEFVSAALLKSPRLLVVGDFNVHAEGVLSGAALEFMESMTSMNLSQHVVCPTHSAGHTLDLVFSSMSSDIGLRVGGISPLPVSWSDHYLLKFSLPIANLPRGEPRPYVWARPRRLLDPARFLEAFGELSGGLADDPVEVLVNRWYDGVTGAVDRIAPKRLLRCGGRSAPWYTAALRSMKQERRRLEGIWRADRTEVNWAALKQLTGRYVRAIRDARKSYVSLRIGEASNRQAELFRVVRDLSNPGQLERPPPSEFTSEQFAAHFRSKIEAIQSGLPPACSSLSPDIPGASHPLSSHLVEFGPVSSAEASRVMAYCRPAATPFDPCPAWLVKSAGGNMPEWVSAIATASFGEGIFPSRLKETVVKPTLKKPGLAVDDLSNYRPIAIVPYLGKVVERVAAVRLQSYLEENHVLDPFQSGFRPFRGTETVLVALQDDLLREADRGCSSLLVLLDLSAAFDTVDHGNLLARLAGVGIGGLALSWLRSFLGGRSQQVQLGDDLSAPWTLPCGVPQGSAISPMLFNVYMRPLAEVIRRFGVRCHQYADDTQLYLSFSSSAEEAVRSLDLCLEAVLEWARTNRLKLNPGKTEVLFFGASSSGYNGPLPRLGGVSLQPTDRARNLGVVLDSALSLEAQVMAVSRAAFVHLRRIAQIRQYLDEPSLRTVVQALVISRIDYCNALYVGLPLTLLRRLQRVQNAAARLVVGARRFEHITPVLARLHWLPAVHRIRFKVLVLVFKALHGLGPGYLSERIAQRSTGSRPSRMAQARSLRVATPREAHKSLTRNRAFSVAGPTLWNQLPSELRLAVSLPAFKKALKTHLFKEAFGDLPT